MQAALQHTWVCFAISILIMTLIMPKIFNDSIESGAIYSISVMLLLIVPLKPYRVRKFSKSPLLKPERIL
jgi:hypothetical protein